jgi:hypothetical protein
LKFLRQIGVFDAHAAFLAQIGPELRKHGRRGAHAATAYELIKAVCGGRDAEAEEHQRTHFAVQLTGLGKLGLEPLDLGGKANFVGGDVGHGDWRGWNPSILQRKACDSYRNSCPYVPLRAAMPARRHAGQAGTLHAGPLVFLVMQGAATPREANPRERAG